MSAIESLRDNGNRHMRDLVNVVNAHDAVHPDRSVCGGVGACILMRAEVEAEQELIDCLACIARFDGAKVALSVTKA